MPSLSQILQLLPQIKDAFIELFTIIAMIVLSWAGVEKIIGWRRIGRLCVTVLRAVFVRFPVVCWRYVLFPVLKGVFYRFPVWGWKRFSNWRQTRRQAHTLAQPQGNAQTWGYRLPRIFWDGDSDMPQNDKIPSGVLWYKIVMVAAPVIVTLIVLGGFYLPNQAQPGSATAADVFFFSLPATVLGFSLLIWGIVTFTQSMMSDQDPGKPWEVSWQKRKVIVLATAGAIIGIAPFVLSNLVARFLISIPVVWGTIWAAYGLLILASGVVYTVRQRSKRTPDAYVALLLWIQYFGHPLVAMWLLYSWTHKFAQGSWIVDFFVLVILGLVGIVFVLRGFSLNKFKDSHRGPAIFAAGVQGVAVIGLLIFAAIPENDDIRLIGALITATMIVLFSVIPLIPVRYKNP